MRFIQCIASDDSGEEECPDPLRVTFGKLVPFSSLM